MLWLSRLSHLSHLSHWVSTIILGITQWLGYKENLNVLDRVPMSTEGKLSRIQRGWCWHWRHGHCTRYGAHVWNLDFPPQSMHYSNKKNLPAGNMKKCPNLSLKDVIRIYILLPLFTEKVAVLFSSSTFLKMSLRSTIFLGDLFGPLTWCSRALRFAHLSCTLTIFKSEVWRTKGPPRKW